MTDEQNQSDEFPPLKLPHAKDIGDPVLDDETSRRLRASIEATVPKGEKSSTSKFREAGFTDLFPNQEPLSQEMLKLEDIRLLLSDVSTKLDSLPQMIAQALGGRT